MHFILRAGAFAFGVDSGADIWYNYTVDGIHGITVTKDNTTTEYVFRRNAQGDVTHIYKLNQDKTLSLAAEYKYDAWGKCEVEEVDGSGIGALNPIRYRGYYFDTETGLYYLNARYYDPETGRFISADDTKFLDPHAINGLNLFAYCGNNPVMNFDPTGRLSVNTELNVVSVYSTKGSVWRYGRNGSRHYVSKNIVDIIKSCLELRAVSWEVDFITVTGTGVKLYDVSFDLFETRIYMPSANDSSYLAAKFGSFNSFLGFDSNEWGFSASATAIKIGGYSKYVDFELLIGSIGVTFKYSNGTIKIGGSFIIGFEITLRIL